MRQSLHNPKYTQKISSISTDAVVMRKSDWKRVKASAIHLTAKDEIERAKREDEQRKNQIMSMTQKRQTIYDSEQNKQILAQQNADENELEERERILRIAEAKANEELDEVKALNAEMMAARVRTIRDAQLAYKKQAIQREREIEQHENEIVEENRKRAVEIYATREKNLLEQRRRGSDALVLQIQEKKAREEQLRRQREQEKEEMMRARLEIEEEDRRLERERRQRADEYRREMIEAGNLVRLRKQREKQRDMEEVQAMVEYQRQQAEQEAEFERQQAIIKQQKAYDCAEVRKQQQKAIDTQAQEDELRARRYTEEANRKERERELAEQRKREQVRQDMLKARDDAIMLKKRRLLEMAKIEKAEFDRLVAAQQKAREQQQAEERARKEASVRYRDELQKQLMEHEEQKRIAPLKNLDESKHYDELNQDYASKLEAIRQAKIAQLQAEGVPEKYLTDIRRKRLIVH